MLTTLLIKDFTVIEFSEINFQTGFTAVTGETGAGKSVLMDALSIVLGGRASAEFVRHGRPCAEVQAQFDIEHLKDVRLRLTDAGLDDSGELVLRRLISANGRSRAYVNDVLVSAKTLAEVTNGLVDITGQNAQYTLMRREAHLELVDRIGGLVGLRAQVKQSYENYRHLESTIDHLSTLTRERTEREDFIRFQLNELTEANVQDPAEEEQLEEEAARLRHSDKIRQCSAEIHRRLYADDASVLDTVRRVQRTLESLADIDDSMARSLQELNTAAVLIEDVVHSVGDYQRTVSDDPQRSQHVEARLMTLSKLRRKYGCSLADVMARQTALEHELEHIQDSDEALQSAQVERMAAGESLLKLSKALSEARRSAAESLSRDVQKGLAALGMKGARLVVEIVPSTQGAELGDFFVGPTGLDRLRLRLQANPGASPLPLEKVASGGELSRVMLAIKRVIAERDPVSTYVFDEVEQGVAGATADHIGAMLTEVGRDRQVLCISHSAPIVSRADHHLLVEKTTDSDGVYSRVLELDIDARVDEVSRLLSGARQTTMSRNNARELLGLPTLVVAA